MVLLHGLAAGCNFPWPAVHGTPVIYDQRDYENILYTLYQQSRIESVLEQARSVKKAHDSGEVIVRLWLDGFFGILASYSALKTTSTLFTTSPN